jgi:hypothetical protein
MSGDAHVRICESLGVKFPRATRLVGLDRRLATLALAHRRSEWICYRRPGPASKRQPRGATAHGEAPEIGGRAAARHDNGQASFIRRGAGENGPSTRTSPTQGPEQSCGEFAPAGKATRTDHEAIQISPAGTTVSVYSRSDRQPFSCSLSGEVGRWGTSRYA